MALQDSSVKATRFTLPVTSTYKQNFDCAIFRKRWKKEDGRWRNYEDTDWTLEPLKKYDSIFMTPIDKKKVPQSTLLKKKNLNFLFYTLLRVCWWAHVRGDFVNPLLSWCTLTDYRYASGHLACHVVRIDGVVMGFNLRTPPLDSADSGSVVISARFPCQRWKSAEPIYVKSKAAKYDRCRAAELRIYSMTLYLGGVFSLLWLTPQGPQWSLFAWSTSWFIVFLQWLTRHLPR